MQIICIFLIYFTFISFISNALEISTFKLYIVLHITDVFQNIYLSSDSIVLPILFIQH